MMIPDEHAEIAETLEFLFNLRGQCAYRGRGWWLLNNAMCHLSDYFWDTVNA